jgi:hypothetical protein
MPDPGGLTIVQDSLQGLGIRPDRIQRSAVPLNMAHVEARDTWEQGPAYERYVGRWSRQVAPRFLEWLRMPGGLR